MSIATLTPVLPDQIAGKIYVWDAKNERWTKSRADGTKTKWWRGKTLPCRDLGELRAAVEYCVRNNAIIVRGELVHPDGRNIQRLSSARHGDARTIVDCDQQWVLIDIDECEHGETPEEVRARLPRAFRCARSHWWHTASSELNGGTPRYRAAFWLDRAVCSADLAAWLGKIPAIDESTGRLGQPTFVVSCYQGRKAPRARRYRSVYLDGGDVTVPERVRCLADREADIAREEAEREAARARLAAHRPTTLYQGRGDSTEWALARLADDIAHLPPRGQGLHPELRRATYVARLRGCDVHDIQRIAMGAVGPQVPPSEVRDLCQPLHSVQPQPREQYLRRPPSTCVEALGEFPDVRVAVTTGPPEPPPPPERLPTLTEAREQLRRELRTAVEVGGTTVFQCPTGVGKTYASAELVRELMPTGIRSLWATPTRELAAEALDLLGQGAIIRTSRGKEDDPARGTTQCLSLGEYVAHDAHAPGLGQSYCASLCPHRFACPALDALRLARRYETTAPCVIITHHALLHSSAEDLADYQLTVIDESTAETAMAAHLVRLAELRESAALCEVPETIVEQVATSGDSARRILAPPAHVGVSDARELLPVGTLPDWRAIEALATRSDDWQGVTAQSRALHVPAARYTWGGGRTTIVLDATSSDEVLRSVYGEDVRIVTIRAQSDRTVIQVVADAYRYGLFTGDQGPLTPLGELILADMVRRLEAVPVERGAVILDRKTLENKHIQAALARWIEADRVTYHGSAKTRGSNAFKDAKVLIVGEYYVPKGATDALAQSLGTSEEAARWQTEGATIVQAMGRSREPDATIVLYSTRAIDVHVDETVALTLPDYPTTTTTAEEPTVTDDDTPPICGWCEGQDPQCAKCAEDRTQIPSDEPICVPDVDAWQRTCELLDGGDVVHVWPPTGPQWSRWGPRQWGCGGRGSPESIRDYDLWAAALELTGYRCTTVYVDGVAHRWWSRPDVDTSEMVWAL